MNRRLFFAGAGGAIGRRLCPLLIQDGWQVTGTTRSQEKVAALRDMGVEGVVVDVFDAKRLHETLALAQPEIVLHQLTDLPYGLDPMKMAEARLRNARIREVGTRNLVAAALAGGVKRMIAQSIAFAYTPGIMPYQEDAPLNVDAPDEAARISARAVASLEQQVLDAPWVGIVLRYGRFYGPGTGLDTPPAGGSPVHIDAAADATQRAITQGQKGIYNIAEDDGTVSSARAARELGWHADFRLS